MAAYAGAGILPPRPPQHPALGCRGAGETVQTAAVILVFRLELIMNLCTDHIPDIIKNKFEFLNYNHALEILQTSFQDEWKDISLALRRFYLTKLDIMQGGGNESPIPPKFSKILSPRGWKEIKITGDLCIKFYPRKQGTRGGVFARKAENEKIIKNYIDGYNIDYVKSRVAIDVEWNSKDQTFDRDLFAMRTYYECDIISVGVIITRSESLNNTFRELNIINKYGASTTWMGKLKPRLDARRHGGCPLLAVGITDKCIID